jgi:predicted enzyme related to lactoylglutathione lyase
MSIVVRSVTIDCQDPYQLARWWCTVFGVPPYPEDHPGDPEALCVPVAGELRLLFERVPEAKAGKNRVHLDLHAGPEGDREIARLTGLGARLIADNREPDGTGWVVLADPEGNEFCVERGVLP